jgi:MFS family permease
VIAATRRALSRSFQSLAVPNYRRYFVGQVISLSGNWMQAVAEMWLILRLTGSGVAVGITAALQFLPILLAGAWGGLLADRVPKRKLLIMTQALMALPALALWGLASTGAVEAWMVYALVFTRGAVNAVDNPARQSFVMEMVGRERIVNAVSLNSLIVHSARIVGPALAGVLIATVGVAPCFLINALSFGAMLIALSALEPAELHAPAAAARGPGQLREALRHVAHTPELRTPLALMALVGTLAFNFQVILPLLARFSFHGGPATYAALTTAMGIGAVAGALAAGTRRTIEPSLLATTALAFGALCLAAAAAPTLALELVALLATGAASVTFAAGVNSTLQLAAEPSMRGRVMALYAVVFLGSTPIGAPIAGWLASAAGPRSPLVLAGVAALIAGGAARRALAPAPAGASLKLHDPTDRVQPVEQPLDVARGVVHRERRPGGGRHPEPAHQWLSAVMSRPHANALAPEDLADVVRVGTLQGERDERPAVFGGRRTVDRETRHVGREPRQRLGHERCLVRADPLDPECPDPVDRRAEADRLGDL